MEWDLFLTPFTFTFSNKKVLIFKETHNFWNRVQILRNERIFQKSQANREVFMSSIQSVQRHYMHSFHTTILLRWRSLPSSLFQFMLQVVFSFNVLPHMRSVDSMSDVYLHKLRTKLRTKESFFPYHLEHQEKTIPGMMSSFIVCSQLLWSSNNPRRRQHS